MITVEFSLVLETSGALHDSLEDAIHESGCDDATLSFRNGIVYLNFERRTENLESAILSAIRELERARVPIFVIRIEPSDLVTAAEIARRLNRSRQSVHQLIKGARSDGDFPVPEAGITTKTMIWSWKEVVEWFMIKDKGVEPYMLKHAKVIKLLNDALRFRHHENQIQQIGDYINMLNSRSFAYSDQQYSLFK